MDMNPSWKITIRIIVFSALLGGASGVLTSAITNNYLSDYSYQLGELTEPLRVTQARPRALPASYESALELIEATALPAVGASYGVLAGSPIDQFQSPVIVLTSDGWMIGAGDLDVSDRVRIGTEECLISEVVYDRRSGFSFVRCDAQNLPVVDFGDGYNLSPGDQVFVAGGDALTYTRVKSITYGEVALRSSDSPARQIILETDLFEDGAAVFNIYGELVGLTVDSAVMPLEHVSSSFNQVLSGEKATDHPSLAINTIDLSRTVGVDNSSGAGALLSGWQPVGPGTKAGLVVGDVIFAVDGDSIGDAYTLDDLLAKKVSGQTIRIEFLRDDERQEVEVILGSVNQ
jgi:hypothetical protein